MLNAVPVSTIGKLYECVGHASIAITRDVFGHVSPDVSREALDTLSAAINS